MMRITLAAPVQPCHITIVIFLSLGHDRHSTSLGTRNEDAPLRSLPDLGKEDNLVVHVTRESCCSGLKSEQKQLVAVWQQTKYF